jgi:S-adenosylmethionine-diacylgycerolhomoserine-N-methlytransferase
VAVTHGDLMDGLYRYQRHIYDASRTYYLLGRDHLLRSIDAGCGEVLEIGCGTGRNLIAAAKAYPRATFHGLDVSAAMLETAGRSVARAGLAGRIHLAKADAAQFESETLFGVAAFHRVFFSYSLSMIPDWPGAFERGLLALKPGGSLHAVDFGALEGLPRFCRKGLYAWLEHFHVCPIADDAGALARIAARHGAGLSVASLFKGYAWYAEMARRPLS